MGKDWPGSVRQLPVAALLVERVKLSIMSIHEDVLMLYLAEGEEHLRAHCGVAYFFDPEACWVMFSGVIPTGCLVRLKTFFLRLEGFFPQHVHFMPSKCWDHSVSYGGSPQAPPLDFSNRRDHDGQLHQSGFWSKTTKEETVQNAVCVRSR